MLHTADVHSTTERHSTLWLLLLHRSGSTFRQTGNQDCLLTILLNTNAQQGTAALQPSEGAWCCCTTHRGLAGRTGWRLTIMSHSAHAQQGMEALL